MKQVDPRREVLQVLSLRPGPQPRSSEVLPFRQLDQWPPGEIHAWLLQGCAALPEVLVRESRMGTSGTRALCLPDPVAGGPADAFIDCHEFCHLHALPEGTIHLVLPASVLERALAQGWVERHPIATMGILRSLVMVYAPRNAAELEIVLGLIGCSREFARGDWNGEATQVA